MFNKACNDRNIYIWGAGSCGQDTFNFLKSKFKIIGFIDSDHQKWGSEINGVKIFSPQIIMAPNRKPFIIIASTWAKEIAHDLEKNGFYEFEDFQFYNNLDIFNNECEFINNELVKNESHESLFNLSKQNGIILSIGENNPTYFMKLKNLFLSIKSLGKTVGNLDLMVVFMDEPEPKYRREIEELGVRIRIDKPINPKYRHNNKIRLLEKDLGYDWYILLDHDIIVCRDFSEFLDGDAVRVKPVDVAIINDELWMKIYSFFNIDPPEVKYVTSSTGELTMPFFNSGVVIVPGNYRKQMFEKWRFFAEKLIIEQNIIKDFIFYIDEIALALALQSAKIAVSPLPVDMNFHLHIPVHEQFHPNRIRPFIVHYHHLINESGFIKSSFYTGVQEKITAFNTELKKYRRNNFNNETFWDFRYAEFPEFGSGIGSRGETLAYKRSILEETIKKLNFDSLLDIGCGDQYVTNFIEDNIYTGIDISSVVVENNKKDFPKRTFINSNFLDIEMPMFDITICLDVLIHLPNYLDYRNFVERIVRCTKKYGIVAGFEDNSPTYHSELTFYHEPLSKTLNDFKAGELTLIGKYRGLNLWLFKTTFENSKHNNADNMAVISIGDNHISNDNLRILSSQSEDPDLLNQLVRISAENFGFFPKHTARAFEYVWVLKQMNDLKGKNILDLGSGVNPLPIFLTLAGAKVYTLDSSNIIRYWDQDKKSWNEWGYLDYGKKYPQIRSFNTDVTKIYFANNFFDYIYSVSVIEHMPTSTRKSLWNRFHNWLKSDGLLLLTIDLYKDSTNLWNYCYGKIVEDIDVHGNVEGLKKEAKPYFNLDKININKNIHALEKLDIATIIGEVIK